MQVLSHLIERKKVENTVHCIFSPNSTCSHSVFNEKYSR